MKKQNLIKLIVGSASVLGAGATAVSVVSCGTAHKNPDNSSQAGNVPTGSAKLNVVQIVRDLKENQLNALEKGLGNISFSNLAATRISQPAYNDKGAIVKPATARLTGSITYTDMFSTSKQTVTSSFDVSMTVQQVPKGQWTGEGNYFWQIDNLNSLF